MITTRPIVHGTDLEDLTFFFDPGTQLVTVPFPSPEAALAHLDAARPGWSWTQIVPLSSSGAPEVQKLRSLDASEADGGEALRAYIAELLEIMGVLFGAEALGVRVKDATRPPCPRFHVDKVAVRAVLALSGSGPEWLPEEDVDRRRLGHGAQGLPDERSGLIRAGARPRRLESGLLCLFKGEHWPDNEGRGLVHRSPVDGHRRRWLATLDLL